MLTQATIDKMHAMKLTSLAEAFNKQTRSPECAALSFEERVGMMIDTEYDAREQRKLTRRLRWARLRHQASLEDVDWQATRGLDRQVVLSLGRCGWIRDHQNLLITGPAGIGKSWLACAFAERACRSGHSAYYVRAPRLHQIWPWRAGTVPIRAPTRPVRENGPGHDRRLRPLPAQGPGAARPAGNPRGSSRTGLDPRDQPAPLEELARGDRRDHPGGCDLRPADPRCPQGQACREGG